MKVYVRGALQSELSKSRLCRAVEFYAEQLGLSQNLRDKITLFVRIEKQPIEGSFVGLCTWLDEQVRPREFSIRLYSEKLSSMLCTLAHEMVHVRQYAKGQLRDLITVEDTVVWQGKRMHIDNVSEEYLGQPWEEEAFSLEKKLSRAFIKREKSLGLW